MSFHTRKGLLGLRWVRDEILVVVSASLLFIGACAISGESTLPQKEQDIGERVLTMVRQYVAETRGWPADSYRIEEKDEKGGNRVFWVVHQEDLVDPRPGGDKSFELHLDPELMQVVKEVGFQ